LLSGGRRPEGNCRNILEKDSTPVFLGLGPFGNIGTLVCLMVWLPTYNRQCKRLRMRLRLGNVLALRG
jgi:hypothetical protein